MKIIKIIKRNFLYLFLYSIGYYFFVRKLAAVDGEWHWNLFAYYGYVQFGLLTVAFFVVTNIADRCQ